MAVLAEGASPARQARAIEWMHANPAEQVVQALANDLVDQLVLRAAEASGLAARLPVRVIQLLSARRMLVAVNVIRQEHVLGEACALLDEIGVEYVVFKGALVRQFLYAKPYLRPSADVDLLVPPGEANPLAYDSRTNAALSFDNHLAVMMSLRPTWPGASRGPSQRRPDPRQHGGQPSGGAWFVGALAFVCRGHPPGPSTVPRTRCVGRSRECSTRPHPSASLGVLR